MKYREMQKLAKEHNVSTRINRTNYWSPISGEELFQKLIEACIIPDEFSSLDYHDIQIGDLGFYSTADTIEEPVNDTASILPEAMYLDLSGISDIKLHLDSLSVIFKKASDFTILCFTVSNNKVETVIRCGGNKFTLESNYKHEWSIVNVEKIEINS